VSDRLIEGDDANTPLMPAERDQLIPAYITLRGELNAAEQANIADALTWLRRRKREVLDAAFLCDLHRRMFGQVWRWAGGFRTSARNIGVAPFRIATDLRQLIDDTRYQVENHSFPPDALAVRFSHRLVFIHPFPNGNGRHSRLAGDLLAMQLKQPPFTWGRTRLDDPGETRARYVSALRAADQHDYAPLLAFARS